MDTARPAIFISHLFHNQTWRCTHDQYPKLMQHWLGTFRLPLVSYHCRSSGKKKTITSYPTTWGYLMKNIYSVKTKFCWHRLPPYFITPVKSLAIPCLPRPPGAIFDFLRMLPWRSSASKKIHSLFSQLDSGSSNFPLRLRSRSFHTGSFLLP